MKKIAHLKLAKLFFSSKKIVDRSKISFTLQVLLANLLNVMFPIIIARAWGKIEYGSFAGFWSIVSIISVALIGIQTTVATHSVINTDISSTFGRRALDQYSKHLILFFFTFFLITLTLNLLFDVKIFDFRFTPALITLTILSGTLNAIAFGKIVALGKLSLLYRVNTFLAISKIATVFIALQSNISIFSLLTLVIAQQLIYSLILFIFTNSKSTVDFVFWHPKSIRTYLVTLVMWSMVYSDVLAVRFQVGPELSALYAVTSNIAKLLILPVILFSNVTMGFRSVSGEIPNLRSTIYRRTILQFICVVVFAGLFLSVFQNEVVVLLYGIKYSDAALLVPAVIFMHIPLFFALLLLSLLSQYLEVRDVLIAVLIFATDLLILTVLPLSLNAFLIVHTLCGTTLLFFLEFRKREMRKL